MDERTYTADEIAETLRKEGDENISLRTVRYYTQERIIPPLKQVGNRLAYTEEHLLAMRAARRLAKSGRKLDEVRDFLENAEQTLVYSVAAKPDLLAEIATEQEGQSSIRVGVLTLYYPNSFDREKLTELVRTMDEVQKA